MKRTIQRMTQIIRQFMSLIVLSIISAFISVVATLIAPILIGRVIDQMVQIHEVNLTNIVTLLVVLLFVYLIGNLFLWILSYSTNKIAYQSVYQLRTLLYKHVSILPLNFYDTTSHGDVMSRFVNDVDIVSDGLLQGLLMLLQGVLTIIGSIGFMLSIDVPMSGVVVLSAPLSYVVARTITKRSQYYFQQQAKHFGELSGFAEERIQGQKTLQAFQQEENSLNTFKQLNETLYHSGFKSQFISALSNPSTRIVNNIFYAIIGVIGSVRAIQGDISVGDISSFLIFATIFGKPFNDMTSVLSQIQSAFASAQRIFSILDETSESSDEFASKEIKDVKGYVRFRDVSFSYVKEKPLIEHLYLDIMEGSKVAIVGQTGAGKTTLVNLLMRFYDVNSGFISIDGVDIKDVTRDNLRSQFGMVLQDTWLFNGSIRDNIAYGKENATMEEIVEASKASGADAFIRRLEYGYDTVIGSQGDNISQGQKQLLTIARVMLANPPMLILDEATSNIDTYSERRIQVAFEKLTKNRTSFMIAHRLSTIKNADIILVMDKGSVIESGSHDDLLKQQGYYAKLYQSQFSN